MKGENEMKNILKLIEAVILILVMSLVILAKNLNSGSYIIEWNDIDNLNVYSEDTTVSDEVVKNEDIISANDDELIGYGKCGENLQWTLNKDGVLEISGSGEMYSYSYGEAPWYENSNIIKEIMLPSGITSIGDYSFYYCNNVSKIDMQNSNVTKIGCYAFDSCYNLTEVILSESLISISDYAFYSCSKLSTIIIPPLVNKIGEMAFYNSAYKVVFQGNAPEECAINFRTGLSFDSDVTLYYLDGKSGWTNTITGYDPNTKSWKGYNIDVYDPTSLANGYCGKDLHWRLTEDGVLSITGHGDMFDYNLYSKTSPLDPYRSSIVEVLFPEGITSIGDCFFYNCYKISLSVLPKSINSIGERAFSGCDGIKTLILKDNNLIKIGNYAFSYCNNLTDAELPKTLTKTGNGVFQGCKKLERVKFPTDLNEIGWHAFYGCNKLTDVILPNTVTTIEYKAFFDCSAWGSELSIPESVEVIGTGAFSGCNIDNISVDSSNLNYYSENQCLIDKNGALLLGTNNSIIPSNGTVFTIDEYAFYLCEKINSIIIPEIVTTIGDNAFYYCSNLRQVFVGKDVVKIGFQAFKYCHEEMCVYFYGNAPTVYYPNQWSDWSASFDSDAFLYYRENTSGWTDSIAYNVDSGKWNGYILLKWNIIVSGDVNGDDKVDANDATQLARYVAGWKIEIIEENADLDGDYVITPRDSMILARYLANWTGYDNLPYETQNTLIFTPNGDGTCYLSCVGEINNPYVVIPEKSLTGDKVTNIGENAFKKCVGIKSITIPNSVTSIGSYAFNKCSGLSSITIPDSVTSIGNFVFSFCEGLEEIIVDSGNTMYHSSGNCIIETSAQKLIAGSKNSTIPNDGSVTNIGYGAFYGCTSLNSIAIPNSVTSIGERSFEYCESLSTINYRGTEEEWNNISKGNYWDSQMPSYTVVYNYKGD